MEPPLTAPAPITATSPAGELDSGVWDAVVIGAGPAGATAARTLAAGGRSVLLVDRSVFPRPKVCGCCLGGAAMDALQQAGLAGTLSGLRGSPIERVEIRGPGVDASLPMPGLAVSRSALDAMLVRAAVIAGAAFFPGVSAAVLESGTAGSVVALRRASQPERRIRAKIAIVADGIGGRALGEPAVVALRSRIGLSAVIDSPFEAGVVRMACGRDGYVGAVRLEDGRLNLAAAIDPAFVRRQGGPAEAVAAILRESGLALPPSFRLARWHGTPALTRHRAWLWRPGVLVLGDAAAYVEPFTGEGIGWGIASGLKAGNLILHDRPEAWPAAFARLIGRRQRLCRAVAWLLRRPRLVGAALRTLAVVPSAARPALRRVHAPLAGGLI